MAEPTISATDPTRAEDPHAWATDMLLASDGICPGELLEKLMANPNCVPFGPVHHYLVGATLLACHRNAEGAPDRDERLAADLAQMRERSSCVPGAACAQWGVCGAAASAGMAFAIVSENAPLKKEGWSEGQLMVARILNRIARTGAPRCCKRDSRIAVEEAARTFNEAFSSGLRPLSTPPVCSSMKDNTVCLGPACPYHPAHEKQA